MKYITYIVAAGLVLFILQFAEAQIECGEDFDAKLSVWVDDAPDCVADESYCTQAGLTYVCEQDFDTGNPNDTCQTGVRVRCSFPDIPTPLVNTPATMMKVISYNIWETRYLYNQNGQRERTCRILPELIKMVPEVDVIVFNEVFMGGCFASGDNQMTLREILTKYGFTEYTRTVGFVPTPTQPESGGVFIASKWPISRERLRVFEATERTTSDSVIQKGVAYARIDKTINSETRRYHIFGTELQSTDRRNSSLVRILQAQDIYDFQQSQSIPPSEAVIYAGDFNADRLADTDHVDEIFGELRASLPEIVGSNSATYDEGKNDVFGDRAGSDAFWYDYALHSNEHLQPNRTALRVLRPRASPFTVCMVAASTSPAYPDSRLCATDRTITDLSNHFAVLGTFDFGNGEWSTMVPTTPTTPTMTPSEGEMSTTGKLENPEQTTKGGAERMMQCTLSTLLFASILYLMVKH